MFKSIMLEKDVNFKDQVNNILMLKDIVARHQLLTALYLLQASKILSEGIADDQNGEIEEKSYVTLNDDTIDAINELLDLAASGCDLLDHINQLYNQTGLTDIELNDNLISPSAIADLKDKNATLTETLLNKIVAPPSPTTEKNSSFDLQFGIFKLPHSVPTTKHNKDKLIRRRPSSA